MIFSTIITSITIIKMFDTEVPRPDNAEAGSKQTNHKLNNQQHNDNMTKHT